MAHVRPYTADEDRFILNYTDEGWPIQKIAFRLGRSADGVGKRLQRLNEAGIDREYQKKLHRLAIGFMT